MAIRYIIRGKTVEQNADASLQATVRKILVDIIHGILS